MIPPEPQLPWAGGMWTLPMSFKTHRNRKDVGSSPSPPTPKPLVSKWAFRPEPQRTRWPCSQQRVCSEGTRRSRQETRSCLNDRSCRKTMCPQPAPKPGLHSAAGLAPAENRPPGAASTCVGSGLRGNLKTLLPCLSVPLGWSMESAGSFSG